MIFINIKSQQITKKGHYDKYRVTAHEILQNIIRQMSKKNNSNTNHIFKKQDTLQTFLDFDTEMLRLMYEG